MTTSRAAELLREREDPQRATFLELFFDLVLIFAFTRVSARLVEVPAPEDEPMLTCRVVHLARTT